MFAQRQKRVARAATGMNAADPGAYPKTLLEKSDTAVQVAAP